MKLLLQRETFTDRSTIGTLYIDGEKFCFTLEDRDRHLEDGGTKILGETAIPRGVYDVMLEWSPRFKHIMPLINNVPQFSGVRMHWGNKPEDTEGCILVGDSVLTDWISHSRATYSRLLCRMEDAAGNGEKITLEIV